MEKTYICDFLCMLGRIGRQTKEREKCWMKTRLVSRYILEVRYTRWEEMGKGHAGDRDRKAQQCNDRHCHRRRLRPRDHRKRLNLLRTADSSCPG